MNYNSVDTAFIYPTVNWAEISPFDPMRQNRERVEERTAFTTRNASSTDFFASVTGPRAPTVASSAHALVLAARTPTISEATASAPAAPMTGRSDSDVERIARKRVQLMAAKYARSTESPEIVARLEILNHRLLGLAPRVSKDQVAALENANDQLAQIRSAREERSARLGIPAQL